jgi:hypothetical protein
MFCAAILEILGLGVKIFEDAGDKKEG